MFGLKGLAAVIAVVLGAIACGNGQSGSPAPAAPVTLKIQDYSVEQTDFHKQVAAEYHRANPNVTIEWTSIAQAQYEQTLPLAFSSKQAPDIFYWTNGASNAMNNLLANGWIQPWTTDASAAANWEKRWPSGSFLNGITQKSSKLYGFPWQDTHYWGPGYMYMNKAIFQQAGLDVTKPPATWTELSDACKAIKAKTKAYCIAAPLKGTDFQRLWYALAAGRMSDTFFDYKNGRFSLDDPRLIDTFNYIVRLNKSGYLAPGVNDKDFSRQQFAAGQAGIYMDGPWMVSVWDSLGFHSDSYAVAAHPMPDDTPYGALSQRFSQYAYWLSSQSTHQAAAFKFIQWVTNPTGFFVQNFLKNSFATLAFADNKKFLTDPAWKTIFKIADTKGFRVVYPEPLLECPDLTNSKAYTMATQTRPNGEWEVMVQDLTANKDMTADAKALVNTRQTAFLAQLQKEQASGLKVSKDCYTFSSWNYNQDFSSANYPKS